MEKKSKKSIIIGITLLLLVTLTLLGLTYAYYRTRIIGNEADTSVSVTSQILEVVYSDNNATFQASGIAPGYSNESNPKTFTVENTGTEKISYSIKLDNIDNEFNRLDWTYELLQGETIIETGVIPNGASEVYIANSVEIDTETTQNFKLIIRYANSLEDQSEDMEKSLSFRINIADETGTTFKKYASEGTLLAAIERDNDLASTLSTAGESASWSKYNEISEISSYKTLLSSDQSKYIAYADSYKFNEWGGTFDLVNPQVGKYSEVYTDLEGKYIIKLYTSLSSSSVTKAGGTSVYKITSATLNRFEYDETTTTRESVLANEAVLASTKDDYGDSYYFRGGVENNYVNYSGMCWRIVRIQGNGAIKLVLADRNFECSENKPLNSDGTYSGYNINNENSAFITDPNLKLFAHYSGNTEFSPAYEDSDIFIALNSWLNGGTYISYDYEVNDKNEGTFLQKISDENQTKLYNAEWCNDLSIGEIYPYDVLELSYGPTKRFNNPSLKCDFVGLNDSSAIKHLGKIGMLTTDEILFAGWKAYQNGARSNSYLETNSSGYDYFTMSPSHNIDNSQYFVHIISTTYQSTSTADIDTNWYSIRPAVVLNNNVLLDSSVSGQNGTQTNPYVIS